MESIDGIEKRDKRKKKENAFEENLSKLLCLIAT